MYIIKAVAPNQAKTEIALSHPTTVLFVCTGNSCRSQMAEALLRHVAGDRFEALSAGTRPAGVVQPLALETLQKMGVCTEGLRSKHIEEFADRPVNIAITVCDNASAECPTWLGADIRVHWGLPDPTFAQGTDEERLVFCTEVAERILKKVTRLAMIRFDRYSKAKLNEILNRLADL